MGAKTLALTAKRTVEQKCSTASSFDDYEGIPEKTPVSGILDGPDKWKTPLSFERGPGRDQVGAPNLQYPPQVNELMDVEICVPYVICNHHARIKILNQHWCQCNNKWIYDESVSFIAWPDCYPMHSHLYRWELCR